MTSLEDHLDRDFPEEGRKFDRSIRRILMRAKIDRRLKEMRAARDR